MTPLIIDLPTPQADRVRCVMSLRGTESDAYGSFNACHYVGDRSDHVATSRRLLATELGIDTNHLVIPRQTHSLNVATVKEIASQYDDTDALVTDQPGIALCINTADCVPVILIDTVHNVIGIAHSGWRGTVGRIATRTLDAMARLGTKPNNVHTIIGACICPKCFEVGDEVADRFVTEFPNHEDQIVIRGYDKPHIDLNAAIRTTLIDAGVDPTQITTMDICSRCGALPLFSARRDGITSGRTLTAVVLRPTPHLS